MIPVCQQEVWRILLFKLKSSASISLYIYLDLFVSICVFAIGLPV